MNLAGGVGFMSDSSLDLAELKTICFSVYVIEIQRIN